MQAEPDLNPAPHFPYAVRDDATNRAIDVAVLGVENLIHQLVRRSFPTIDRADHEDYAQRVRIHLAIYSLPRFDASRGIKVSTFLHQCISNMVRTFYTERRQYKRTRKSARPQRLTDATEGVPPAADQSRDRSIQRLAESILSNPEQHGLTPTQCRVLRAVTAADPGMQMRAVAASLGYASPTSLSPVLKRIRAVITNIDDEDSDAAVFPMTQHAGGT